ncbi:MAG TPA: CheR family methyltransferase [Terracidiphilus sp.]|jgi:chemotaxis protein methyltransferase WspC|nr:CheR family methyltransferase [Terracidiphilus sp.]
MRPRLQIEPALLDRVAERLAAAAGMDITALDAGRMQWAIEARCRHLGLTAGGAYLGRLASAPEELDDLIDFLVIQETRFFRDPDVFEHIRLWATKMLSAASSPLRILSAPCSTGQEAYSLAACLHHAGLPLSAFSIDAFDISSTALAAAQRGVYHENALKDVPEELRTVCGVLCNQHWRMHDALRTVIRFERRNLAHADALDGEPAYHLILCRNLFIYFHPGARAALAGTLARSLAPGGRLVLGSADRVPELARFFAPLKPAASFAFTQVSTEPAAGTPVQPKPAAKTPLPAPVPADAPRPRKAAPVSPAIDYYRRALDHHEQGSDRQAERRCRQALYLAPGYLPALELLQILWRLHPNLRLRRALSARILRARGEAESYPPPAREKERA